MHCTICKKADHRKNQCPLKEPNVEPTREQIEEPIQELIEEPIQEPIEEPTLLLGVVIKEKEQFNKAKIPTPNVFHLLTWTCI